MKSTSLRRPLRKAATLFLGVPCMVFAVTGAMGCNGNSAAKSGNIPPASFQADPSRMSPKTREMMEKAMRGGQSSPGAPSSPAGSTPAPEAKP